MNKISVIGLGIIGAIWAKNLQADGLKVRGWNRSPKKELSFFEPDLRKAVEEAELIFIVVADPPAVAGVLDQIVPILRPGQLVVQSSTISAAWTRRFAEQVRASGADFLEAPFTGSKPAAEARKTVFYLGGEETMVEKARPVLKRIAEHVIFVGPLGSASSLKLALNLNLAHMANSLSESLALARSEGIRDEVYFEALHLNAGRSPLSDLKEPKLKAGDFSPQFSLKHMNKDLRLALETAGDLDLPQAKALKLLYDKGIADGWGEEDFTVLARLLKPFQKK